MEEFPQDCWIVEKKLENTAIGEKYTYASFRALSQMTWRSFDTPKRVDERWIAIVSMVIGFIMCSAFISCLITAFGSMSATGNAYKDIMAETCSNLLNKGMFLLNKEFTEAVLIKLDHEFFNAGDIIIHRNAQPDKMFTIGIGLVLVKNEDFLMELSDGDHIGGDELYLFAEGYPR
ncbi:hypothetical protein R3I93_018180 [Phoxinus phoxinus]|uniref:Cyclic nucleotide-binding domain-containing protein n=1 Tax=Phoxinus phoxinus TaxID=58324 RepID=A0AAN9CFY4_9TELE